MKILEVSEYRKASGHWHTQRVKVPNSLSKTLCELVALGLIKSHDLYGEQIEWKIL